MTDDSFLLLFNAHVEPVAFTLPAERFGSLWEVVLDTAVGGAATERPVLRASARVTVAAHAAQVMRRAEHAAGQRGGRAASADRAAS